MTHLNHHQRLVLRLLYGTRLYYPDVYPLQKEMADAMGITKGRLTDILNQLKGKQLIAGKWDRYTFAEIDWQELEI